MLIATHSPQEERCSPVGRIDYTSCCLAAYSLEDGAGNPCRSAMLSNSVSSLSHCRYYCLVTEQSAAHCDDDNDDDGGGGDDDDDVAKIFLSRCKRLMSRGT